MGTAGSKIVVACGKKKDNTPASPEEVNIEQINEGEGQLEDIDDGGLIEDNKDNYFDKGDFEKIARKFPESKDWTSQSLLSSKVRPRQKKIKCKEGEIIGNGSFGRVIMGLNLQTGSIMAVKQVQIGSSNTQSQQERIKALEIEIDLLSHLSHKNIVRYYGSHRSRTTFNIFLEYISGGTIASLIDKYGPLNENLARVYARQILEGLEYLHVRNTVHRDIKGANVLVDNSGICKLADFGTAKRISAVCDGEFRYMPSIRGTVNWMAPEVIKQTSLGRYSDIWSVGCTVLEMVTGKTPWSHLLKPGVSQVAALYQIGNAQTHPPLPDGLAPETVDFLKQCFQTDPKKRPNVIKLLNHPFICGEALIEKVLPLDLDKHKSSGGKLQAPPSSAKHKKSDSVASKTDKLELNPSKPRKDSNLNSAGRVVETEPPASHTHLRDKEERKSNLKKQRNGSQEIKGSRKNSDKNTPSKYLDKSREQEKKLPEPQKKSSEMPRSLHDTNPSNLFSKPDFGEDNLLRGERLTSQPEHLSTNRDFPQLQDSSRILLTQGQSARENLNPFRLGVSPENNKALSTREIDLKNKLDPVPMSHRKVRSRPLGKSELSGGLKPHGSLGGKEDELSNIVSTLGDISSKPGDVINLSDINPVHLRTQTNLGLKDGVPSNERAPNSNRSHQVSTQKLEGDFDARKSQYGNNQKQFKVFTFETQPDARTEPKSLNRIQNDPNRLDSRGMLTEPDSTYKFNTYKTEVTPKTGPLHSAGLNQNPRLGSSSKFTPTRDTPRLLKPEQINPDPEPNHVTDHEVSFEEPAFQGVQVTDGVVADKGENKDSQIKTGNSKGEITHEKNRDVVRGHGSRHYKVAHNGNNYAADMNNDNYVVYS